MFRRPEFDERQQEFNQNFVGDNDINMNIDVDMFNANQMAPQMAPQMMGNVQQPIIEPVQERVVNRTILHEVPHICPQRTRVINNHVFRHTYRPHHTCCEENVVTNVQCGSCCQFR